jgi:hypothetical protein
MVEKGIRMTTFTVEKLPEDPILLATMTAEYSVSRDQQASDDAARALLAELVEPMYLVVDITKVKLSIDDITLGSNRAAREGHNPLWHDPRIKQIVFVSTNKAVHLAAKGVNTLPFGFSNVKVFNTLDEALAHCRSA